MKKLIIPLALLMVVLTACSDDEIDIVTITPDQVAEETVAPIEENVIVGRVIEISEKAVTIQEMNGALAGGGGMGGMPENAEGERPEGMPENAEGERPEGMPENAEGEIFVYTIIEETTVTKDGSELALSDVTVDGFVELTFNKDNEIENITILQ